MKLALLLTTLTLTAPAADLVLRNGKIVTLNPSTPQAQAVAITAGKIVALGTDAQMARHIQPATRVIDLQGHLAIPGFIEGHGHFTGIGQMKMNLNLRDAREFADIGNFAVNKDHSSELAAVLAIHAVWNDRVIPRQILLEDASRHRNRYRPDDRRTTTSSVHEGYRRIQQSC